MKKLFITEMSSNTTETISTGTMKETKKERLKRAWQYYEESKERLQKWLVIEPIHCLRKKKIKKMGKKEFLKFGGAEMEKPEFHSSKNAIPIDNVNVNKKAISNEFPCTKWVLSILLNTKITKMVRHCVSCSQE